MAAMKALYEEVLGKRNLTDKQCEDLCEMFGIETNAENYEAIREAVEHNALEVEDF